MNGFRYIDHTADIQSQSWGRSLEEAFSQSALSLMAIITPNLNKITPEIKKKVKIEAEDKEALLFDFLSELLFIFDVDELVFKKIKIMHIQNVEGSSNYELEALLEGEKFDKSKHEIGTEVKAITYSFMEIIENKEKVEIKVVFDI